MPKTRLRRLLAFVLGAALPLAFAPISFYPLAVLLPAGLFYLWLHAPAREAAWLGFAFGLGLFGFGVSWVYVAIHVYGYTAAPIAALMTLAFVAFLALFPAVQGYVSARLLQRFRQSPQFEALALLLILPAVWLLFEWVRGWFLTGFPWLNLGYSHIDSPLAGMAPWLGVYGVGALSIFSSGLLTLLFRHRAWRTKALLILIAIWSGAVLAGQVEWTRPVGKPLRVSIVQGNMPQITKWDPDQIQATLDTYAGLTREHWDSELIFWPENSVSVFYHQLRRNFFQPLQEEAQAHGAELIVGLPYKNLETGRYYSSLMSLGKTPGIYHKRHLVPFGEYVPLESLLRGVVEFFDLPMSSFSPGERKQELLHAAGQPLAPSICYEDAFGEELIDFLPEATLLINGSNNGWYGDSLAPHQHLQIARMRALETGRDLMRATTNGVSALVDYRGRIISQSPQFKTFVLQGQVQPRSGATPYSRFGNWPVLTALGLIFAWLAWRLRRTGD